MTTYDLARPPVAARPIRRPRRIGAARFFIVLYLLSIPLGVLVLLGHYLP